MNLTRLSKSGIEYLDYVWNFYSGCLHKLTAGICPVEKCWAEEITIRFGANYPNDFRPTYYPEAFLSPLYLKRPARIGCAFMGDLFGDWVDPFRQFLFEDGYNTLRQIIFFVIRACPQHTFVFLTKRPRNLALWEPFPDNCQVGVTATNAQMFYEAQEYLSKIVATGRYISLEPYLDRIWAPQVNGGVIDQLIIGAQTKPYKPPEVEWVREIIEACDKAGIPVFLKDNLGWPRLSADGALPFYKRIPSGTMELRQEMPNV